MRNHKDQGLQLQEANIAKNKSTLALRKDGYLLKALASMSSLTSLPRSPQNIRKSSVKKREQHSSNHKDHLKERHCYLYPAGANKLETLSLLECLNTTIQVILIWIL